MQRLEEKFPASIGDCTSVIQSVVTHYTDWADWFIIWHRGIRKCIPKLTVASYVRTRCQVVFDNEHSSLLWKRHLSAFSVWRPLTDRHEQIMCELLCSHSDIVCLLIQSDFTELQP
jgi:hypothetical protein